MRADDKDRKHALVRLAESVVGVGLIGAAVFVFKTSPEHGSGLAMLLAVIGGALFDRRIVSPSNIKRILEK